MAFDYKTIQDRVDKLKAKGLIKNVDNTLLYKLTINSNFKAKSNNYLILYNNEK